MEKNNKETNWLERLVTAIAAILVVFTFAFLIYQIIFEDPTEPNIEVTLGEISEKNQGFSVPVLVENTGSQTAKDISIEISSGTVEDQENGQITFQYLPGNSSVRGWVTFSRKPQRATLTTQVIGYSIP